MLKSCTGKILCVDLTEKSIRTETVPEKVYDALLSGKGLAAWYLYRNIPAGADPLGEDNILAFVSGALTGTGALLCGRWTVACKSPLTGTWGDANCGGVFSPAIKQCGYDGIFFSGISEKPVYLYCDNTKPALSSVRPGHEDSGYAAAELLDQIFRGKKPKDRFGPSGWSALLCVFCVFVVDGKAMVQRAASLTQIHHGCKGSGNVGFGAFYGGLKIEAFCQV